MALSLSSQTFQLSWASRYRSTSWQLDPMQIRSTWASFLNTLGKYFLKRYETCFSGLSFPGMSLIDDT